MKFLVGVDHSQHAKTALGDLLRLVNPVRDQVELAHFKPTRPGEELLEDENSRAFIRDLERICIDAGVQTGGTIIAGDPRAGLCDTALSRGSDCIVMGSRGVGKLQSAFFGSVSSSVVMHSAKPVLVFKAPLPATPGTRYMYCHDSADPSTSAAALKLLLTLVRPKDVVFCITVMKLLELTPTLRITTGCDPNIPDVVKEINDSNSVRAQTELSDVIRQFEKCDIQVTSILKTGDPQGPRPRSMREQRHRHCCRRQPRHDHAIAKLHHGLREQRSPASSPVCWRTHCPTRRPGCAGVIMRSIRS